MHSQTQWGNSLYDALSRLGFEREATGCRRGTLGVEPSNGWLVFRDESGALFADGRSSIGWPGLWKVGADGTGRAVFEIPAAALAAASPDTAWDDDRDPQVALVDRIVRWVSATAAGGLPVGWQPPSADELTLWAPPPSLSVRREAFARQARLVNEPGRLAIELSLTGEVSSGLSSPRLAWLDGVLASAERRWRMVRVERAACGGKRGRAPQIEIDISGAPSEICESLLRAALAAMQAVGQQLLETVNLLSDSEVACATWEIDPCELSSNP